MTLMTDQTEKRLVIRAVDPCGVSNEAAMTRLVSWLTATLAAEYEIPDAEIQGYGWANDDDSIMEILL